MKTLPAPSLRVRILSLEGVSPSLGEFPPPRTYQSIYMAGHKSALSAAAALASEADDAIADLLASFRSSINLLKDRDGRESFRSEERAILEDAIAQYENSLNR